jgi:hypothetical protein
LPNQSESARQMLLPPALLPPSHIEVVERAAVVHARRARRLSPEAPAFKPLQLGEPARFELRLLAARLNASVLLDE